MELCQHEEACFFGDFPTLSTIRKGYGSNAAVTWLIPQLFDLSEYCGCKGKISEEQMQQCATVIATTYHYLTVSELMLFFFRFKAARYGRFYGSVDPLVITSALREFVKERNMEYHRHEQEERERKERESKKNHKPITWDEYCMRQYGEVRTHPMNRVGKAEKHESSKTDDYYLQSVKNFVADKCKMDKETYERYVEMFRKRYGCTPDEYIKKNEHE